MITRSELQSTAGMTRKALRVYEQAGLLVPRALPNGRSAYDEDAVERARFIVTLRNVGVPLSVIGRLLDPVSCTDGFVLTSITEQLSRNARQALAAIELIEAHAKRLLSEVFDYRYGGSWSMGLETVTTQDRVVAFIQSTAKSLRDDGYEMDSISALYLAETDRDVRLRVFRLCARDEPNPRNAYQRFYLPKHRYLGIQATGFFGDYHCFDDAYAKIAAARAERKLGSPPHGTIEIYKKYPLRMAPGRVFESMILA